jgi:hypothetical protein
MNLRTEVERFEHAGRTVVIAYDDDPVNPLTDWESLTTIACWHGRLKLGQRTDMGLKGLDLEETREAIESHEGSPVLALLPVYLYEHSGITMSCGAFSDPWDSGQVGWAYVTEDSANKMGCVGDRWTTENLEKAIRSDVDVYDQYLRGEVYVYFVLGMGEDGEDGDILDSVGGHFGDLDYVRTEARAAAESSVDPAVEALADELAGRATYAGGMRSE